MLGTIIYIYIQNIQYFHKFPTSQRKISGQLGGKPELAAENKLLPGLVNTQKAIEHGHRNIELSQLSHSKW
jgi:hypothetical protein